MTRRPIACHKISGAIRCRLTMERHPPEVRCEGVRGLLNFVGCALGGARDEAMDIAVTVLAPFFGAPAGDRDRARRAARRA